jgi:hypothetical protein
MIFFIPNFREWGVFQRNQPSRLTLSPVAGRRDDSRRRSNRRRGDALGGGRKALLIYRCAAANLNVFSPMKLA